MRLLLVIVVLAGDYGKRGYSGDGSRQVVGSGLPRAGSGALVEVVACSTGVRLAPASRWQAVI